MSLFITAQDHRSVSERRIGVRKCRLIWHVVSVRGWGHTPRGRYSERFIEEKAATIFEFAAMRIEERELEAGGLN